MSRVNRKFLVLNTTFLLSACFWVTTAFCDPPIDQTLNPTDSDLVKRGRDYGYESKAALASCRAAVGFSMKDTPPQILSRDPLKVQYDALDVVEIVSRNPPILKFSHFGSAYDGCNCDVIVSMENDRTLKSVDVKRGECSK